MKKEWYFMRELTTPYKKSNTMKSDYVQTNSLLIDLDINYVYRS